MSNHGIAFGRDQDPEPAHRYSSETHDSLAALAAVHDPSADNLDPRFELMGEPEVAEPSHLTWTDLQRPDGNPLVALLAIPDTVEAAARSGRSAELGDRLAIFEQWAATASGEAQRAQLARCQAILGIRPADDAFTEAIDRGQALPPFERARTELLYGEGLRRERRRQDARAHLRRALESSAASAPHRLPNAPRRSSAPPERPHASGTPPRLTS